MNQNRTDVQLAVAVERRIAELWRERAWWRANRWADWPDIRREHAVELRALVRLARTARRLAEARPDPLTESKRYDSWTAGELSEAFGR